MKTFLRTVTVRGGWLCSLVLAGGAPTACGTSPSTDVARRVADAAGTAGDDGGGRNSVAPSDTADARGGVPTPEAATALDDGGAAATDDASGAGTPSDGSLGWGTGAEGGAVVAFPGALGFGQVATGGRGGSVYHVTNLNDTGPGSFRDAVSAPQRIIVFDVGGYISVSTPVSLKSHLTIAGQTAPGDGIGIMAGEASFSGATDVIVRYMRFRQGTLDPDSRKSGINLVGASRIILDHVSIEFAQWNNIDSVGATNVTVQYSIDANPIGQQFAAHTETGPYTWFGNLFANAHNRNPLAKANTQFVNNVVYDFQAGYTAGNTAGHFTHDVVGNYFISGPATTSAGNAFFQINTQAMFFSGNFLDDNGDGALNGSMMSTPSAAAPLAMAWSPATASLPTVVASAAYAAIVAGAGASLHRDAVDALVVSDATSLGKLGHLWTTQVQTGLANTGYGSLAGGTPPLDTDQDGMPDAWETRYGLNPGLAGDANGDFDHTGYTNIEKYINGLVDRSYPTQ